jgi:hypothetical protein
MSQNINLDCKQLKPCLVVPYAELAAEVIIKSGHVPVKITYGDINSRIFRTISPDITMGDILYNIKKELAKMKKMTPDEGVYMMIEGYAVLPCNKDNIKTIYNKYKSTIDNYLHLKIYRESTFGAIPENKPLLKHQNALLSDQDAAWFWCCFVYRGLSQISLVQYIASKCATST